MSPLIYTSHSDHGLLSGASRKTSFQCLLYFAPCCDQYMLQQKVWVLFIRGSFYLLLKLAEK